MMETVDYADYSDRPCHNCKRPVRWRVIGDSAGPWVALVADEPTGGPHACIIRALPRDQLPEAPR